MAAEEAGSTPSALEGLRHRRRKLVKRYGKRLIRSLTDYMGRQSYVSNDPVLPTSEFPWAVEITDHWRDIRRELDALLVHRNALPNFQDISPDQYKISPDDQWSTFVFWGFGIPSLPNQKRCPRTAEVLSRVPRLQSAFRVSLAEQNASSNHISERLVFDGGGDFPRLVVIARLNQCVRIREGDHRVRIVAAQLERFCERLAGASDHGMLLSPTEVRRRTRIPLV